MKWIGFAAVTLLSIVSLGYLYLLAVKWLVAPDLFFNPSAWTSTGVFGDTFGGLTAIFSALASAGVVYSLIQQQKVLDRQEAEIKDNKNLAIEQMNLIKAQTFDAAFYNMLAIFNSMKSANYGGKQFQVHYENNLNENSHMRKVTILDDMKRRYTSNEVYGLSWRMRQIEILLSI